MSDRTVENSVMRLPAGTTARVRAVLRDGERLADFWRTAIAAEIERRETGEDTRKASLRDFVGFLRLTREEAIEALEERVR